MAIRSIAPGAAHGEIRDLGTFDVPGAPGMRRVRIYLPRGYDRTKTHRALYMFDGQNVFGDEGSFAGGWHLHTAVDRLATRTHQAPVIVAIDHAGVKRIEELTPFSAPLDALIEWIADGVRPAVARHVNLGPGPVHAAVGGSSMGGAAALYAHFSRGDVFGGAMAMSPSLWVAKGQMVPWLRIRPRPWVSRVYIDCGAREGGGRMLRLAEEAARILVSRGWDATSLRWYPDPRGTHSEAHWRRRALGALRFMYRA